MSKKRTNYKGLLAAANKRAREANAKLGRKRHGRRRKGGSGGKIALTSAGIKRAFNVQALALAAAAALGARALYGYLVDMLPDLDDNARAALAGAAPILAAVLASGNPAVVAPVAAGAAAVALADMLGDKLGEAVGDSVPLPVSDALSLGIGYKGREAAVIVPEPTKPLSLAVGDASLSVQPPPVFADPAAPDTGIGEVSFLQVSRAWGA
jgi:hypothetical protein